MSKPENLCVRDILIFGCEGLPHVVPIYQRNYAWGGVEIGQLVEDVFNAFEADKSRPYYLGTLVVCRKGNSFEVIDGQQRLTTLHILAAALGCHVADNLRFQHRKDSDRALQAMRASDGEIPVMTNAIMNGFHIARSLIGQKIPEDQRDTFRNFFENKLQLLRVEVPPETDLMRYFEIMNSRGEQLEKHEILKARLMGCLPESDHAAFAMLWEACADMERHVVANIPSEFRKSIFSEDMDRIPDRFEEFAAVVQGKHQEGNSSILSISDLIKGGSPSNERRKKNGLSDGKEVPVIDFPNFLLHALRIHVESSKDGALQSKKVELEDGRLLGVFEKALPKDSEVIVPEVRRFAHVLLKCRLLLDNYVIRRGVQDKGEWDFSKARISDKGLEFESPFFQERDRLLMLQTMFHVSFAEKTHKYWLSAALSHLYHHGADEKAFADYLENLGRTFLLGRYGVGGVHVDYQELVRGVDSSVLANGVDPQYLNRGTGVPHFIFNWLDYVLWRHAVAGRWEEILDCAPDEQEIVKSRVKDFRFSFRSSVEHYYPQNPSLDENLAAASSVADSNLIDQFGNLCLISSWRNSSLSNHSPALKRAYHRKHFSCESIKQEVMMAGETWGPDEMEKHGNRMAKLLNAALPAF